MFSLLHALLVAPTLYPPANDVLTHTHTRLAHPPAAAPPPPPPQVDVLEYHPDGFAFSAYKQHPLPAVLRVRTFVDVHEFAGRLALTRKNIMLRDHYRCQ